jgi:hypothetical protein
MHIRQWASAQRGKSVMLALIFAALGAMVALMVEAKESPVVAEAHGKLECTIFNYSGQDFVRTNTTLVTEKGKSAIGTKLDHRSAAYQSLMDKHSYTGDAPLFGHTYVSDYAPLTDASGQLTGAIFVATRK